MTKQIRFGLSALIVLLISTMILSVDIKAGSLIHNGIYIDGIDMSGKTVSEATSIIEEDIETSKQAKISLSSPTGYNIEVSPSELGMK